MGSMAFLEVQNLSVELVTRHGVVRAVNDLDLQIQEGEILGLVGESGSGKTITCRAILRLLPKPAGRFTGGRIGLEDDDPQRLAPGGSQVGRVVIGHALRS